MRDIFLGPILSLYSFSFYQRVIRASLDKGFLYLAYLSGLAALLATLAFGGWGVPRFHQFFQWFKQELPVLKWTREGVSADVSQPFTLKHPEWGTILVINTQADMPSAEEMEQTLAYLTKTKLIVHQSSRRQYRVFDFLPAEETQKNWKDFTVTSKVLQDAYQKLLPWTYPVVFLTGFFMVLIWKILAALLYSILALILNRFRREKLGYGPLLNCSMFALTAVMVLQILGIGMSKALPPNLWTAMILTGFYLWIGVCLTQPEDTSETAR